MAVSHKMFSNIVINILDPTSNKINYDRRDKDRRRNTTLIELQECHMTSILRQDEVTQCEKIST